MAVIVDVVHGGVLEWIEMCGPENAKPPGGRPTGGLSILMFGGPSRVGAVVGISGA